MKLSGDVGDQFCRKTGRGFTLVEMLLVLVILSTLAVTLAVIVWPKVGSDREDGQRRAARTQMEVFRTALAAFEIENGHYPQGPNGLLELVQRPRDNPNWHGPYLDGGFIPKDPWGHDYLYECPGRHNPDGYDIISMGRDGVLGTDDDITSWQPEQ
jgi:general secretion pathway protein G